MKNQEFISRIDQHVIDFIRDLRNKKGANQNGLASILGVTKSFISNAESPNHRAKYNLTHINILADHYGLSPRIFIPEKAFPEEGGEKKERKKPVAPKKTPPKKGPGNRGNPKK